MYTSKSKDLLRKMESLELLYKANEKLNKPEEAYIHFKNYTKLKDSLENIEVIVKIETIELKRQLETSKNEAKIQSQKLELIIKEKDIERNKYYLIISISIALLIFIIGIFIFRISKINKEKELLEKSQSLNEVEAQLIAVKIEQEQERSLVLENEVQLKNNRIKKLANIINQKNELLEEFSAEEIFNDNNSLKKRFKKLIDSEEDRNFFNQEIKQIDTNFHIELKNKHTNLTVNDLKLCSMLKIGLSSKEMASLLSISSTSVDVARSRLRAKINLNKGNDIITYLNSI